VALLALLRVQRVQVGLVVLLLAAAVVQEPEPLAMPLSHWCPSCLPWSRS
jgi:hypothetical protein